MNRRIPSLTARTLLALLLGLAAPGKLAAAGPEALREGWRLITNYRFNEAETVFRRAMAREVNPEVRYALAIALLNRQPKTRGSIDEARMLLALAAREGRGEVAAASRFYLARILQLHQERPDPAAAKARFAELGADPDGGFWGEAAKVKWATIHLYEVTPPAEKPVRLAEVEALVGGIRQATLRKDLHVIVADGYEKFRVSDEAALRHLEAAWAIGIERGIDQADFLARMGELARRTGATGRARDYYTDFLRRFRRDERVPWMRARLADLEASPVP